MPPKSNQKTKGIIFSEIQYLLLDLFNYSAKTFFTGGCNDLFYLLHNHDYISHNVCILTDYFPIQKLRFVACTVRAMYKMARSGILRFFLLGLLREEVVLMLSSRIVP